MKLIPMKAVDVPRKRYAKNALIYVLEEFHNTDYEAVAINWREEGYKNAGALASSIAKRRRVMGYNMSVVQRGDYVYLVKNDYRPYNRQKKEEEE